MFNLVFVFAENIVIGENNKSTAEPVPTESLNTSFDTRYEYLHTIKQEEDAENCRETSNLANPSRNLTIINLSKGTEIKSSEFNLNSHIRDRETESNSESFEELRVKYLKSPSKDLSMTNINLANKKIRNLLGSQVTIVPTASQARTKGKDNHLNKVDKTHTVKLPAIIKAKEKISNEPQKSKTILLTSKKDILKAVEETGQLSMKKAKDCSKTPDQKLPPNTNSSVSLSEKVYREMKEAGLSVGTEQKDLEKPKNKNVELICKCGSVSSSILQFTLHGKCCTGKVQDKAANQTAQETQKITDHEKTPTPTIPLITHPKKKPEIPSPEKTITQTKSKNTSSDTLAASIEKQSPPKQPNVVEKDHCRLCGKKSVKDLFSHRYLCPARECKSCKKIFPNAIELYQHRNQETPCRPRLTMCQYCFNSFTVNDYPKHECVPNLKYKSGEFKCPRCQRIFISKSFLSQHRLQCEREHLIFAMTKVNEVTGMWKTAADDDEPQIFDEVRECSLRSEEESEKFNQAAVSGLCKDLASNRTDYEFCLFEDNPGVKLKPNTLEKKKPNVSLMKCDFCTYRTLSKQRLDLHRQKKHQWKKVSNTDLQV